MRKFIALIFMFMVSGAYANTLEETCGQGVWAAYEAYLMVVYDAKHPNGPALREALDYRISQQPFETDVREANRALAYITGRLYEAGVRRVTSDNVSLAASEFIKAECLRHGS